MLQWDGMDACTYEFHSQGIVAATQRCRFSGRKPVGKAPCGPQPTWKVFFSPSALVEKMEASMEALQIVLLPSGVASSRSHIVRERPLTTFPSSDFSCIILDSRDFFFSGLVGA
jgi:hypothetical protein